jgi:hypothetical protein
MGMTKKVRIESSAQSTDLTSAQSYLDRVEGKGAIGPTLADFKSFWIFFTGQELVAQAGC